ncbi:MAG: hypothetical protein L0H69_02260 [Brevibacterium sp.]|nr:hypothetical protein [Brevibacterium sp.]MDN5875486.1 hypothetical protein [Brevibacterium sp.]MDN5908476.1 hypothetical protein [Brevibacterium sp.]MDN6665572.1 hypothetical protein [Brevibacterium sp.]
MVRTTSFIISRSGAEVGSSKSPTFGSVATFGSIPSARATATLQPTCDLSQSSAAVVRCESSA